MKIENISFQYGKNESIFFKNMAVTFAPSQLNFIQGDNGVGKSTLFTLLGGKSEDPAFLEGAIVLGGHRYKANGRNFDTAFTQHVRLVQQDYNKMIADQFSFIENLQMANMSLYPALRSLPPAHLLDKVENLSIDIYKPAWMLSGGQKQLLAILMALQKPVKVILLDEPTATLDQKNSCMVIEFLQDIALQLKITVLLTCHNKELLDRYGKNSSYLLSKEDDGQRILQKIA